MLPETKYALSGDTYVAYQVTGNGTGRIWSGHQGQRRILTSTGTGRSERNSSSALVRSVA